MNPAVKVINPAVALTVVKESEPCSRCRREAVLVQRYSGRALCREHLLRDVESRAKRAVRRQGGLRPDDRVAVLTGDGPADAALLAFLERRPGRWRAPVRLLPADAGGDPVAAAANQGCTVLAEAVVLEDMAVRVLGAVLDGRQADLLELPAPGAVRVIRPFSHVPEEEVRWYAAVLTGLPCDVRQSSGDLVEAELARHTSDHPSAPFALARLADALVELAREDRERC